MSSNVVTLYGIVERPDFSRDDLYSLASAWGTVWMVRFVPFLRGALIAYSTPEEAMEAAIRLHGHRVEHVDGFTVLRAAVGPRSVSREDCEERFNLSKPKQLIQLVSPPPSPPEWWSGWLEKEEGPKTPPELKLDQESTTYTLEMVSHALYDAIATSSDGALKDDDNAPVRPPTITLQTPVGTSVPQGFLLRSDSLPKNITEQNTVQRK